MAENIEITRGSSLVAGIFDDSGQSGSQAGDISVNATGVVRVSDVSGIQNNVGQSSIGNAGDIIISAQTLAVEGISQIKSDASGQGDAGDIIIEVVDSILLDGSAGRFSSGVFSNILRPEEVSGNAGVIQIRADRLILSNGAQIAASTSGQGDAGRLIINADNLSLNQNSGILSNVERGATGNGGNIRIVAQTVSLEDRSRIGASTRGRGNAGSVTINAVDSVLLDGADVGINVNIEETGVGDGGSIVVEADSLSLLNGAQLTGSTFGIGDASSIQVTADEISLNGRSAIITRVEQSGRGRGGNVVVTAQSLSLTDNSELIANTRNQGDAGNIIVDASNLVSLNNSMIRSSVERGAAGRGGNVTVNARSLSLSNSQVLADTLGEGDAGSIQIVASENISLDSSGIFSSVRENAVGRGGSITLSTRSLELTNSAQLEASTSGQGDAGDVAINANTVLIDGAGEEATGGITSAVNQTGRGAGGDISIATQTLSLTNGALLTTATRGQGNAGSIAINTGSLALSNGAQLSTSVVGGRGNAGDVTITAANSVSLADSAVLSTVESGEGQAGAVNVDANSVVLTDGAQLATSTFGQGDAGEIIINARESVALDGLDSTGRSTAIFTNAGASATGRANSIVVNTPILRLSNGAVINARTANAQPGGNITLNVDTLEATRGGQVITSTLGDGRAGDITLNARDSAHFSGRDSTFDDRLNRFGREVTANEGNGESGLFANTRPNSNGSGGTIAVDANRLTLRDTAQIAAFTAGTGSAGDVVVRADSITLNSGAISTTINRGLTLSNLTGQGDISLQTRQLALTNGATITTSTSGQGNAGDITVRDAETVSLTNGTISTEIAAPEAVGQGGDITIDTDRLSLRQGRISSSTAGQGDAGSITVQADREIKLENSSNITSQVRQGATGNSQRITLNTPNLSLRGSAISAATDGNGRAGDIQIQNADTVSLSNSRISTQVQRNATVSGETTTRTQAQASVNQGNIAIDTGLLELDNRSAITASTEGRGRAGSVTVNNADQIALRGNSTISSEVRRSGQGRGGRITLETAALSLDNSRITASTSGRGRAGNVTVTNAEQTNLENNSTISSAVRRSGQGRGGNVNLETDSLSLNNARINTSTNGQGRAGNITVNANILEANNGGRLVSSTSRSRSAGIITLRDLDDITLSGNNSGIFASTRRAGQGGRIELDAQRLNLNSGATIATTSRGTGPAGNIRVTASESLDAAEGEITTNAVRTAGGNITLVGGNLNLRQGSTIRTDVERGTGDGGDIRIDANDLRLQEDSDIQTRVGPTGTGDGGDITVNADSVIAFDDSDMITEAPQGQGGNIRLNTPVFFGAGYVPNLTVDNADNNRRVDLDASGAVSAGAVQTPDTSFIQNSLADLPANAIDPDALIANSCIARTENGGTFLITGIGGLPPNRPGGAGLSSYPTGEVRTEAEAGWQPGDPIIEPQGVYQLPNGELVLIHECQNQDQPSVNLH